LALAIAAVGAALAIVTLSLPNDFVLPTFTVACFMLAALTALKVTTSKTARSGADSGAIGYLEVAGVLTFIGVCAASQVDPDQMVRLVEGARREP
jgi:hypothetical protein